ncbi:MAG: hypothetical protein K8R21_04620 [Leptospira sp.]|nr:hypothetical protein [Leptospira sp.]
MFNNPARIFLYALIALCVFLPGLEFYYPENSNYQAKVAHKLNDMERQFLLLEKTMRSVTDSLTNSQEEAKSYLELISLSHRIVKRTEVWQKNNSFSPRVSRLGIEYDNLFRKISLGGTGKLLMIDGNLCLAIPVKTDTDAEEIVLSYLEETELHSIRPDGTREFFFPDLTLGEVGSPGEEIAVQNPYRLPRDLLSGLKSEINLKSVLNLNDVKYNSYYSSQKRSNFGFLDGLLFIRTGLPFFNYYFFILMLLIPVAIVDLFAISNESLAKRKKIILGRYEKEFPGHSTILKGIETENRSPGKIEEAESVRPIELQEMKSEGKRIFILPFDLQNERNQYLTPAYLNRSGTEEIREEKKIPEKVTEIRSRIFTPELKSLIEKTEKPSIEKQTEDPLLLRYANWFRNLIPEKSEKLYDALNALYDKEYSDKEALNYLNAIAARVGSHAYTVHIHQKVFGCYSAAYSNGIDYITKNNMLFESDDPYLGKNKESILDISFDIRHIQDQFFLKKFSKEILSSYAGLLAIPLQSQGIDGYFMLFYEPGYDRSSNNLETVLKMVEAMIHPIIPVLSGIAANKFQINIPDNDILVKLYHSMKEVSEAGTQSCTVLRIVLRNYFATPDREVIRNEIITGVLPILSETERITEVSPSEIIVFYRNTEEAAIREIVLEKNKNSFDISFQAHKFPDEGKNYYTYF